VTINHSFAHTNSLYNASERAIGHLRKGDKVWFLERGMSYLYDQRHIFPRLFSAKCVYIQNQIRVSYSRCSSCRDPEGQVAIGNGFYLLL
jgi:hypothetical protein